MKETALIITLMLLASMLTFNFPTARSQGPGTMVYVDPPQLVFGAEGQPVPSAPVAITINVTNVTGLQTWQIKLYFNSSIIDTWDEHIGLPPDHVFANRSFSFSRAIGIDENGKYVLTTSCLSGSDASSFTGSGKLCIINFTAVAAGTSHLNFSKPLGEEGDTWLGKYSYDDWANPIMFLPFDAVDGTVIVRGEIVPKESSLISLSADKRAIYLCDSVTLNGSVASQNDSPKPSVEVAIYILFPGELDFRFFATARTDEEGQYIYVWTVTPYYDAGSYRLQACWHGDETTYGNKSATIELLLQSMTVYIRADGSVDPTDAVVQRNGDVYMLTRNIGTNTDAIIIERDNIILDGTGYVLQGYGAAIILSGRKNVTVRNVETKPFEFGITFHYGIYLSSSSNNNICGNNIHAYIRPQGGSGIVLRSSSNNTVCRNSITNSKGGGIVLTYSSNQNIISENNMINNTYGVDVGHSFNNIVNRNYITSNTYGIVIREFSGNNSIEENTINNGQTGIELCFLSDYNSVSGNELVNNEIGMGIYSSDCNRIFENELLRNKEGIHFVSADRNRIYHNNFINNTEQVNISENVLDDGYPSGGNYWSDYNGTDDYCGPYQNVNGSDGIGDTPHFLNIIHMDNYPLMKPWPRRITVDVYPNILNLKNEIKQITVCIELLKGSDLARINVSSILLNGTFPVDLTIPISCGDYDGDTILDLACSFNRTAICDFILSNGIMTGDVILTITGQLYDGTPIVGNTTIKVRMSGDVNIDGKVDGKDLAFAAKAFDSNPARPNWDPAADENEDGKIDGKDIVFIAKNFGRTYL